MAVGLASQDPSGLAAYLVAEYGGGTLASHQYLSAAELASRFGASARSVTAAHDYFTSRGLSVTVSPDDLLLFVNGPASAVGPAFGTTFFQYRDASGRGFFSHPTPAVLPIGIPWTGALGLGSDAPIVPSAEATGSLAPVLGPAASCTGASGYLTPCQVWNAYSMSSLVGTGINGSGLRIGIVDAYSSDEQQHQLTSDLAAFSAAFGLPNRTVDFAYPVPTTGTLNVSGVNPDWGLEDALDLEWARASAPGAAIEFTFSPNPGIGLYEAIDWLVAHDAVNVISLSWGEPDVGVYNAFSTPCFSACNASTDGSYAILSPVFQFAAAEGISVFAATGDCGASGGTSGVSTQFPASDPAVTGVGGTVLNVAANGTYISEVGWSGNSSGAFSPGCTNQGGSGGGYSPFPRPWWQTGSGLPALPTDRGVPDVAAVAGTPAAIIYQGSLSGVEGTSLATPIWAGIAADLDQDRGQELGFLNPALYRILNGANYSRDFHDILAGNNGYSAGVGWDPVTGIGTPIVASLAHDVATTSLASPYGPSTFLSAAPATGVVPLLVHFSVFASGGSGQYPLEGVYFGDGTAAFATGGASEHLYTLPGVYAAQSYVVDSSGNLSASPPAIVVVGGGSLLNVTLSASDKSPAVGSAVTLTTTVVGGTKPYNYSYYFGDGTFQNWSTGASVVHSYGAPGGFCASVVVSDAESPVDGGVSARVGIAVGGARPPDCANATGPLVVRANASVGVRDAPADYPSLFSVSDGSLGGVSIAYTSSDPYIDVCGCTIFRTAGNFTVEAYAGDIAGQSAQNETNVTVAPPLAVTFTASELSGTAPLTVRFTANASGGYRANATQTAWSFGTGVTAVGAEVTETYADPGFYIAVGSLSDQGHGNASEAFLLDVLPATSSGSLVVTGTISPAEHLADGSLVRFDAVAEALGGGAVPVTTFWDLGNGSSAYGAEGNQSYFGPLPAADTNTLAGEVTVFDLTNGTSVTVPFALPSFFAEEAGGFLPRVSALSASETAGPAAGMVPVAWSGSSVAAGPRGATSTWTFGDGTGSSVGAHVTHTYSTSGNFTATLTASDPYADTARLLRAVTVYPLIAVAGGPSSQVGSTPFRLSFSVAASGGAGGPYAYNWSFGDGTAGSGANVVHTYARVGAYHVVLNVTDRLGDGFSTSWNITVTLPAKSPSPLLLLLIVPPAVAAGVLLGVWGGRQRRRPPEPIGTVSP